MTFGQLLRGKKDAILRRWVDDALATYSGDSAAMFKRQQDPFANPIGHGLRVATQGIFEALLDGLDAEKGPDTEKIREHLAEVLKVRAVQQFSASEAVGFVFRLKQAVRAELAEAATQPEALPALAKFDAEIDRVVLAAFDVFVRCREQLYELRVSELKRMIPWATQRTHRCESGSCGGDDLPRVVLESTDVQREGL